MQPEIKQRVKQLRKQLQEASYAYYVLDAPMLADEVYDRLYRELQTLESEYPELITAESPTQRVGEKPATQFYSVKHNIPLYSLENAFDIAEFAKWQERWLRVASALTPTYQDGNSPPLTPPYQGGGQDGIAPPPSNDENGEITPPLSKGGLGGGSSDENGEITPPLSKGGLGGGSYV
ncbi:MAG: hypothetical protein EAZ68_08035, partial [Oscillatoriales cyanobacterium]